MITPSRQQQWPSDANLRLLYVERFGLSGADVPNCCAFGAQPSGLGIILLVLVVSCLLTR